MKKGKFVIISGPSGVGKDTICDELVKKGIGRYSVSMTTRKKRSNEIEGISYFFVSKEEFKDLQDYMYKVIKQISNEILSGKIDLKPFYKNKKTPCSYCDYRSICNFNNGACQNKYNFIDEKSKKEILEKIKQESRRYAKRQLTWFRKNKQTIWIDGLANLEDNINIIEKELNK